MLFFVKIFFEIYYLQISILSTIFDFNSCFFFYFSYHCILLGFHPFQHVLQDKYIFRPTFSPLLIKSFPLYLQSAPPQSAPDIFFLRFLSVILVFVIPARPGIQEDVNRYPDSRWILGKPGMTR